MASALFSTAPARTRHGSRWSSGPKHSWSHASASRSRSRELCRVAGVSERSLRNAFYDVRGMSPKRCAVRARLAEVRRALSDAGGARGAVTTIATDYGFFELGRFAGTYKSMFGESPSDTLRGHAGREVGRLVIRHTATATRGAAAVPAATVRRPGAGRPTRMGPHPRDGDRDRDARAAALDATAPSTGRRRPARARACSPARDRRRRDQTRSRGPASAICSASSPSACHSVDRRPARPAVLDDVAEPFLSDAEQAERHLCAESIAGIGARSNSISHVVTRRHLVAQTPQRRCQPQHFESGRVELVRQVVDVGRDLGGAGERRRARRRHVSDAAPSPTNCSSSIDSSASFWLRSSCSSRAMRERSASCAVISRPASDCTWR